MGDYFPDERYEEKPKETVKLIENFNDLLNEFEILDKKLEHTTDESSSMTLPILNTLRGSGRGTDAGQIGRLKITISGIPRMRRMPIGSEMLSILDNIDDYLHWSERYIEFLEDYIDGFKNVCKSSFMQIKSLKDNLKKMEMRIRELEDQVVVQTEYQPKPIAMPRKEESVKPEIKIDKKFRDLLKERLVNYINAEKTNDKKKIALAKAQVFNICHGDEEKRAFVEKEFKSIALKE